MADYVPGILILKLPVRTATLAWLARDVDENFWKAANPFATPPWILQRCRSVERFLGQPRERHPDPRLAGTVTLVLETHRQAS